MAKGMKTGGRTPGTLNKATADVKRAALDHAPAALKELARLALEADSETVRVSACREILDRAYGKPPQALTVDATVTDGDVSALRALPKAKREAVRARLRDALSQL